MKLLVISDTHGNYPLALDVLDRAGTVDAIIHVGDGYEDAEVLETVSGLPVIRVPGNCDPDVETPRELLPSIAGVPCLITHGDAYQVKSGLARLQRRAAAVQARLVIFGHTHIPDIVTDRGIIFLNPGNLHKESTQRSYALVTIIDDTPTAEIVPVAG